MLQYEGPLILALKHGPLGVGVALDVLLLLIEVVRVIELVVDDFVVETEDDVVLLAFAVVVVQLVLAEVLLVGFDALDVLAALILDDVVLVCVGFDELVLVTDVLANVLVEEVVEGVLLMKVVDEDDVVAFVVVEMVVLGIDVDVLVDAKVVKGTVVVVVMALDELVATDVTLLGVLEEVAEDAVDELVKTVVAGALLVVENVVTTDELDIVLLLLAVVVLTPVLQVLPIPHVQSLSLGSVVFE